MKDHIKFIHSYQTVKTYNNIVGINDTCISLLSGETNVGELVVASLEELKGYISSNCSTAKNNHAKIESLIDNCEAYDLTELSDTTQQRVKDDRITVDAFADNLSVSIQDSQITNLSKLSDIAKTISNPIDYVAPIVMDTGNHYLVMLNDWLDASSYTLRQIDFNNGGVVKRTPEQIKSIVSGMLNQFENLTVYGGFSQSQNTEVNYLLGVRDQVLIDIDMLSFLTIADYIDANVDKLPLMRRLWAYG